MWRCKVTNKIDDQVAKALRQTLVSPNEYDSKGEAANVVDGLFAIARALNRVAKAIDGIKAAMPTEEDIREEIFQGVKDAFPEGREIRDAIRAGAENAMWDREV
jgi:hypothetical protein